jgi:3-hydroxyacyl-[acyl-carrier-protein] dehydratase
MFMNKQEVMAFLPHRPPFLFVDTVEKVLAPPALEGEVGTTDPRQLVGTKVIAHFEIKEDLEILKGHFPGNPILPGVVQVEMMAQCSAFSSFGLKSLDRDKVRVETLLISVEKSKFRKPLYPGMKLEIHAMMVKCRGNIASYACEVFCEGEKTSESTFLAKLDIIQKD